MRRQIGENARQLTQRTHCGLIGQFAVEYLEARPRVVGGLLRLLLVRQRPVIVRRTSP